MPHIKVLVFLPQGLVFFSHKVLVFLPQSRADGKLQDYLVAASFPAWTSGWCPQNFAKTNLRLLEVRSTLVVNLCSLFPCFSESDCVSVLKKEDPKINLHFFFPLFWHILCTRYTGQGKANQISPLCSFPIKRFTSQQIQKFSQPLGFPQELVKKSVYISTVKVSPQSLCQWAPCNSSSCERETGMATSAWIFIDCEGHCTIPNQYVLKFKRPGWKVLGSGVGRERKRWLMRTKTYICAKLTSVGNQILVASHWLPFHIHP